MPGPNIHLVVEDDGIPPDMWDAIITYDCIDGHHIYKSKDVPGLFVSSLDKKEAQSHIVPSIQALFWHGKGKKVKVFRIKHFNDDQKDAPDDRNFSGIKFGIVPCEEMKMAA